MVSVRLGGGAPATALHIAVRVVRSGPARKTAIPTDLGSAWGARVPSALSISNLVRHGKRRHRAARFGFMASMRSLPPSRTRRGDCAGWC